MNARTHLALLVAAALPACIVSQPLGERDDAALGTDSTPALEASVAEPDAATPPADASERLDASPPPDAATTTPGAPARIVVSATNAYPPPPLGGPATNLSVAFYPGPIDPNAHLVRELARDGACAVHEVRGATPSPPTLTGLRVTAHLPGGATRELALSSTGGVQRELATYHATVTPPLPADAVVRIDVAAHGALPAFSREVTVRELQLTDPTPRLETAEARVFVRSPGAPLPLHWRASGASNAARPAFYVSVFTTAGASYQLACLPPQGATSLTVSNAMFDALAPYLATSAGQPTASLTLATTEREDSLANGTRVDVVSAAYLFGGLRY